jgi:hypothetical protein
VPTPRTSNAPPRNAAGAGVLIATSKGSHRSTLMRFHRIELAAAASNNANPNHTRIADA